jgi:hypothetical protein
VADDRLVRDFMWAVHEIGKPKEKRGWAGAGEIMPHLGLDHQNLTNEDDDLYMSVAQRCEELGYIEKKADMHRAVKITERGKQYVKRSV